MKIINSNRFPFQGTNGQTIHLATVIDGLHEYVAFVNKQTNQCYIEEIDVHGLHFIEDDNLANDIKKYLDEYHLLDMM